MGEPRILVVNPGSTSTKVALYTGERRFAERSIEHSGATRARFPSVLDELPMRRDCVLQWLNQVGQDLNSLAAIAARGGRFRPVPSGIYAVNEEMMADARRGALGEHPSSLACLIAHDLAERVGISAYVVDPISVDELTDEARVTGLPEIPRVSLSHALNMKAIARQAATDIGKPYDQARIIVAHLGGGGSISAHLNGRMIDVLNSDVEGPFSAERAGALPSFGLVNLCFEPGMTKDAVWGRISGKGGLIAHLGTKDAREVETRIQVGDAYAEQIYRAMAYAIAKGIGSMAGVLGGLPDVIAITGGLAKSEMLVDWIEDRVRCLGPVRRYPGEFEMDALARGVLRILRGEEPHVYGLHSAR